MLFLYLSTFYYKDMLFFCLYGQKKLQQTMILAANILIHLFARSNFALCSSVQIMGQLIVLMMFSLSICMQLAKRRK